MGWVKERIHRFALLLIVALCASACWAVITPYDQKPAAMVTQDYSGTGLVWDYELSAPLSVAGRKGTVVAVLDFCHSGGFVNELSTLSKLYVAAACEWDEYSYGPPVAFGQKFMNNSMTNSLHQSYEAAKSAVDKYETPQEASGGLGDRTLDWQRGYRALLFSADETPPRDDFWQDISTAWHSLTGRTNNPWPRSGIETYFGDGTPKDGEIFIRGAATRENLLSAIIDLLPHEDDQLLFLYLNNHGVSTDVLKSRYRGGRYEYEVTTSIYRTEQDKKYGVWNVRHRVPDPDLSHYKNIQVPKQGWDVRILGGWMEWYSTNRDDPSTWLESGVDYTFGYDYPAAPARVRWEDYVYDLRDSEINDFGYPDGSPWGKGWVVYGANRLGALDPSQWNGWDNGGDGWVLAPSWAIPEPITLLLFGIGLAPVVKLCRRRPS